MSKALDKFLAAPASTKLALLILVMGLVGAAWYTLYYDEVLTSYDRELRRTPQLNKEFAEQKEVEKNLVRFEEEITRLKRARDKMRDRLPENAEIAGLLQQIHSQAKVVGLDILSFERGQDEAEQLYARIPVTMTLLGTFHQITTFFYYLGKLTRIVNVENIQLTSASREDGLNKIKAVCNATTFMYLSAEQAQNAPSKKTKRKKRKGRRK